jgi:hypothetical protein
MSLRPLRLLAFRRLLVAYSVNQLGDWAAEISLAVIVFAATHNPAAVAATWVAHRCAFALLAPLLVARLTARSMRACRRCRDRGRSAS